MGGIYPKRRIKKRPEEAREADASGFNCMQTRMPPRSSVLIGCSSRDGDVDRHIEPRVVKANLPSGRRVGSPIRQDEAAQAEGAGIHEEIQCEPEMLSEAPDEMTAQRPRSENSVLRGGKGGMPGR